ncbi:Hsp33 family molecular chaperone HslO [Peptostreptococcus anaerobius]|uniref:Hsp33 family molecular chaperone HslO n=1 Tax=Peptostreptococcus anaerobius TaxID=1261 RepID=UPI001D07C9E5|nr:Hsp33 family molecular chaperone HslO [Peptostreptococcus anaerobius]MCB6983032.1 Hsp33 family molecular chaperone HslO [Peptostreptococcus anaerobius]MCQ5151602.1 Hsp33 family molecular chaperone HslO [Peptostreptococcus anaerobius]
MKDYCLRVTSKNGEVRGFFSTSRNMVEAARGFHNTTKVATAALGRTLTATSMMGLMMKNPNDKVTIIIKGGGPIGTILTTSDVNGMAKGYVTNPGVEVENYANGKLNVAGAVGHEGTIKVIKDLGMREPYNGEYEMVSGEIAKDFTYYFTVSEQTPSAVALGVLTRSDEVEQAGGFIVQMMPDATEETISILENNISGLESVTHMLSKGMTPEDIMEVVMKGLDPQILDYKEIGFECDCSKDRVAKVFVAIGKDQLTDIIEEDHGAEVGCQFCNSKYQFTEEELREILDEM